MYQALWAGPCDFDEVLISPVMIQDHMPDHMLKALTKVSRIPAVKLGNYKILENTTDDADDLKEEDMYRNVVATVESNGHANGCDASSAQIQIATIDGGGTFNQTTVVDIEVHERKNTY